MTLIDTKITHRHSFVMNCTITRFLDISNVSNFNNVFSFQDIMNREKQDQLPLMQVGFIDSICLPIYEVRLIYFLTIFNAYQL